MERGRTERMMNIEIRSIRPYNLLDPLW